MKKSFCLIMGGLGLVALAIGCGGDSTLTKAEFVEQANAICETSTKEQQEKFATLVQSETPSSQQKATAVRFVNKVMLASDQRRIDEIGELAAPSGDEKQVEAILAAMQEGIDAGREQPLKFMSTESSLQKARKMSQAYGLSAC